MYSDSKEFLLAEALTAEERGDLASAVRYLQQVTRLDSEDAVAWALLGHLESDREQYSAAIMAFERALELNASLPAAMSGLAVALENVGRLREAESLLARSIRLRPTSSRYVLLGDAQISLGQPDAAKESFRRALESDPNDEEALYNLAVLLQRDQPEQAISLLRRAIEIDPLYAEAHRQLGFELARQGEYETAENLLRRSIAQDADQPWAHIYLANVLWSQARIEEAEAEFVRSCELSPLWSYPSYLLGAFYDDHGRHWDAQKAYRTALAIDPKAADAAFGLGTSLVKEGDFVEGRIWLERALDLEPTHVLARKAREMLGMVP